MRKIYIFLSLGLVMGFWCHSPHCYTAGKTVDLQALLAKRVPILLEYGRGWCKPCKYMKPILEDVAKAYGPRAIVTTVDMDSNRDLVRTFRIRMMPTQVFITPNGREFFRNEGTLERAQIVQIFSKMGLSPPGQAAPQAPARSLQSADMPRVPPEMPRVPAPGPRKPW
jgi:thioredoxin 1